MSQHLLRRADFVGLSAAAMQRYRQAQRMPGEGEREAQAWHGGAMQMHDLWHYQAVASIVRRLEWAEAVCLLWRRRALGGVVCVLRALCAVCATGC